MDNFQDKSSSIDVNFSCQRCCQPLKLHSTLSNINKETFLDLLSKNNQNNLNSNPSSNRCSPSDDILKTTNFNSEIPGETSTSLKNQDDSKIQNPNVIYKNIHSFRNKKLQDCDYSLINAEPNQSSSSNNNGQHHLLSTSIASSLLSGFDQSSTTSTSNNKSHKDLKLQIQLFDILSDQSDIDHPLCEECADFVIEQMDKQLNLLEQECKEFSDYKNKIEQIRSTTTDEEIEKLRKKLQDLHEKQTKLITGLKDLNKQQNELDDKLAHSEQELKQSKLEEEKYWHEYNTVKFNYYQCQEEQRTLENKIRHAKEYFNKLKRTSIFNLAFSIWYTGPFGTINGFRLGRLPNVQVEWQEINAAWGQCALLLSSLAKKLDFSFQRYKIIPYGNFSFIESLEDRSKQLPLYTPGGIKSFFHQKFDHAMIAFLDCLQQLYEEIQRQDKDFKLPYEMDIKGDIYQKNSTDNTRYTVKIYINTEEKWTKALRFMLTNLKWALAWVASKHGD